MKRKVKEVADLVGISVRTLHHYDEIGLLSPEDATESGYRLYSENDLETLQQILFFRELDFSLMKIKEIINNPSFDQQKAFIAQRNLLLKKHERLERMIATIDKTLQHMKGEVPMTNEEKFDVFKEKLITDNEQQYGKEIRDLYGEEIVNASHAKWRGMSEEVYQSMIHLEEEILELLEKAYATGDPASELAQEVAAKHKTWLMYSWPSYSKEAHAGLAEMYIADKRFTSYYDKRVQGGATFLRDAILIYVGKKNC